MMHKTVQCNIFLEQDKKLLQSLIEKENEQISMQLARREKAKADAHWMKLISRK
ncbi:unnamed protein product [Lymnaea stagnalis]|uniref:Uncharacterized protein n=1 Tax=Lymnaea stagnalis TaxID=6523 RepID=A0AAV2HL58_LYMST